MITLPKETIKEIAENLDMGMQCFVHKETGRLIVVPDQDQFYDMDMEAWEEELKELEYAGDQYLEIDKMRSPEAFRVMEDFIETVRDRFV